MGCGKCLACWEEDNSLPIWPRVLFSIIRRVSELSNSRDKIPHEAHFAQFQWRQTRRKHSLFEVCSPPSCFGPTFCPVDQTVGVGIALTDNPSSTLGDPCSHQTRPLLEEWPPMGFFLIFPGPVCPQMWRCGINTSWHHRLATDIRNAAAFLCHVDFGQKSLWLQCPTKTCEKQVHDRKTETSQWGSSYV